MIGHYVRRFVTSLSRRPPSPVDEAWAERLLTPAERSLFTRLGPTDRRHLVQGARMLAGWLGPEADPVWLRATLLHDVGKHAAGLGVLGRSVATALAVGLGRERVGAWAGRPGWRGRVGRYERHGEIGAAELVAAGSPPEVAAWSALHHRPDRLAASGIPADVLVLLERADR